ncbi:winged-helix domain-containing protein [Nocardioides sp.]|uniref:winged-helix domain-containing protein n=1 Tax=Nocardioides sp. TaxID=35761 RepID=UPI0037839E05
MQPGSDWVAVIIEDDPDVRDLIDIVLTQSGFRTVVTENGPDGVDAVRAHNPLITTLDVNMPGMDGFAVAKRLREFSNTYLIMITALADEIDVVQGFEAGADDYLVKPFRPRELRARADSMLRRPRTRFETPTGWVDDDHEHEHDAPVAEEPREESWAAAAARDLTSGSPPPRRAARPAEEPAPEPPRSEPPREPYRPQHRQPVPPDPQPYQPPAPEPQYQQPAPPVYQPPPPEPQPYQPPAPQPPPYQQPAPDPYYQQPAPPVYQPPPQPVAQPAPQPAPQPAAQPVPHQPVPPEAAHDVPPSQGGWVRFNGLALNNETRVVTVNGAGVELSRAEFDLLASLLSTGRRVRSKADLVLTMRGQQYVTSYFVNEADKRSVEVHIANLRRKLGDDGATPKFIETVRGVGYRLAETV